MRESQRLAPSRLLVAALTGIAYLLVLSAGASRASGAATLPTGGRFALAVLGVAVATGLVLGCAALALLRARRHRGGTVPVTAAGEALAVLVLVSVLHGGVLLWAMAREPALYDAAFYAHGGLRRTVLVLAANTFGAVGVPSLGVLGAVLFVGWAPPTRRVLPWRMGLLLTLLALALVVRLPRASAGPAPPNLIVLLVQSLRADHVDPRHMPHLAALAARGTRFDRAYASSPGDAASTLAWLTGRTDGSSRDALPAVLARAGYAAAAVGDGRGGVLSNADLGFRLADLGPREPTVRARRSALERQTPLLPFLRLWPLRRVFPELRAPSGVDAPDDVVRDGIRAMRHLASGPFALVVSLSTLSGPLAPPSSAARGLTDPSYRGRFAYRGPESTEAGPFDAADRTQLRALYAGAVRSVDDAAEALLDALGEEGLAANTLVVVVADHGASLFDAGRGFGPAPHLFGDEGTHVPWILVDPRRPPTPPVSSIVRDVDLAPTLYALLDVPPPPGLAGASLVPALAGQPLAPRLAFATSELFPPGDVAGLPAWLRFPVDPGDDARAAVARHRMVRDDRWKLVHAPTRTAPRRLLFDTASDPLEMRDVSAEHPEVVERLSAELRAWVARDRSLTEERGYFLPVLRAERGAQ